MRAEDPRSEAPGGTRKTMKIALKLTIALTVPLVALTAIIGYLYHRQSQELLREELSKEGRAIALVVQIAAEDYLRDRQLGDLRELVDRITGYERVLGLRLFDPNRELIYQSGSLKPYPFQHAELLSQTLSDRKPVEMRRLIGGQPALGFIVPLLDRRGRLLGAVQVLQLESYIQDDARSTRNFIMVLGLAMVMATVAIVLLVTRFSISRPAEELVRSFREVGAREVPTRVPIRAEDEFGWLSREFNGMCERLELTRHSLLVEQERRRDVELHLRNAERLASVGRLAAGLAHEIGTPLNVIGGRAQSALRSITGNVALEKNLSTISVQTERIVRIVRDMLDFARMRPPRRSRTNLVAVLDKVLNLLEQQFEARRVRVDFDRTDQPPSLVADSDQLEQVFLNLVLNALDAMPNGGDLKITSRTEMLVHPRRQGLPHPCVAVSVSDTGIGIRPEDRDHVFDPFFTTKEAGQGTGLGLSVSYGIIEEHAGWFELDSEIGRGTRITVVLPATSGELALDGDLA